MLRPQGVVVAVILLCLTLVLGIVNILTLSDYLLGNGFSTITAFLGLFLTALLTWKIWAGRNWARIVFLVFLVLGVPFSIGVMMDTSSFLASHPYIKLGNILQFLFQISAAIFLLIPKSAIWFRRTKEGVQYEMGPQQMPPKPAPGLLDSKHDSSQVVTVPTKEMKNISQLDPGLPKHTVKRFCPYCSKLVDVDNNHDIFEQSCPSCGRNGLLPESSPLAQLSIRESKRVLRNKKLVTTLSLLRKEFTLKVICQIVGIFILGILVGFISDAYIDSIYQSIPNRPIHIQPLYIQGNDGRVYDPDAGIRELVRHKKTQIAIVDNVTNLARIILQFGFPIFIIGRGIRRVVRETDKAYAQKES